MRILIAVGVILAVLSTAASVSSSCKGTINFPIIYEDGQIKNVSVNGDSAMDSGTSTPTTLQRLRFKEDGSFAGENGIEIGRHYIWLIPGGRSGGYYVKSFNYTTETWNTIDVYCPPLGLSYRQERDEVVGFCAVNATYGPITCVPYFTLRLQDGQWVDASRPGSCSQPLSTTNITDPVILQSDSDYEYDDTRLYFAERGTNRLHEVSLSAGEAKYYETDATLKINHLVPVSNASFLGLRVVCRVENSFDYYHKLYVWQLDSTQQQTGFVEEFVVTTESIAFDSYNLDYLVTFNAIRDIVEFEGARSNNFQSLSIPVLDEPIHCQNLVGPSAHFLMCLARNGHLTLLINITNDGVTYQTIESESKVNKIGVLTENTVYLLNDQQKLTVYLITPTVMCLGTYGVRANVDFVITSASSNINCTGIENMSDGGDKSHSSNSDHVHVIAVVIPTATIITIIFVLVVTAYIKRKQIRKIITSRKKKGDTNGHIPHENKDIPKDTNSNHLSDRNDVTIKEGIPINDSNHNGNMMTQPASPDNRDTGARNIEEPPANSVDPCQEVSASDQYTAMVNSVCKGFPNPDVTGKVQNENNEDERQCIEQSSERCIEPRECTENDEENLPPREEPIGHTCN